MDGKRVLVLDGNETSRKFLARLLHERQFTVTEAGSGREALIIAWRDEPDLILFDPVLTDIEFLEFIRKLRHDPRTAGTPLLALSSDPSPGRREISLAAGVNTYLLKSSEAIPALSEALTRLFSLDAPEQAEASEEKDRKPGSLIVFLSAKGGTGTSSLCANLAMNLKVARPEARIAVADLVLPIGSIAPIVGYEGEWNLANVADLPASQTDPDFLHRTLPELETWGFQLLAGSPDPEHGNNIPGNRINEIVDNLLSPYDLVILDIGRSLSRISLPLIQRADLIVLIVSTDLSTIQLTKTVWEYMKKLGVDSRKMYVILNRAVGLEGLTKPEAEEILGLTIRTAIPYMGGNFALANNQHQPISIKYPTDTASIILRETAGSMLQLVRA